MSRQEVSQIFRNSLTRASHLGLDISLTLLRSKHLVAFDGTRKTEINMFSCAHGPLGFAYPHRTLLQLYFWPVLKQAGNPKKTAFAKKGDTLRANPELVTPLLVCLQCEDITLLFWLTAFHFIALL